MYSGLWHKGFVGRKRCSPCMEIHGIPSTWENNRPFVTRKDTAGEGKIVNTSRRVSILSG